jgi:corrinoid protein of di/trimethylamine methyltransferase
MADLNVLYESIVAGKLEPAVAITKEAIAEGIVPQEIINNYMIKGMEEIGQRFQDGKAFVPQLLMAARAMKGSLDLLKPLMVGQASTTLGKVVIGTVKGDLHDIGKNLVASMLEGCGFEVINLGVDVSSDKFVAAVQEHNADIVCMSALLTTTMNYMKEVVNAIEAAGLKGQVKVMIGGAPVNASFASQIGAEGYSTNANGAVHTAKELMGLN